MCPRKAITPGIPADISAYINPIRSGSRNSRRPAFAMQLGFYDLGATPFFALQADQRVSYCLYVPKSLEEDQDRSDVRLIVAVHGTGRTATKYRDGFASLAEKTRSIVLAPLFPVGLIEPGELSNFKRIKFHDMRFDLLLLSMVDEVVKKYGIDARRKARELGADY